MKTISGVCGWYTTQVKNTEYIERIYQIHHQNENGISWDANRTTLYTIQIENHKIQMQQELK